MRTREIFQTFQLWEIYQPMELSYYTRMMYPLTPSLCPHTAQKYQQKHRIISSISRNKPPLLPLLLLLLLLLLAEAMVAASPSTAGRDQREQRRRRSARAKAAVWSCSAARRTGYVSLPGVLLPLWAQTDTKRPSYVPFVFQTSIGTFTFDRQRGYVIDFVNGLFPVSWERSLFPGKFQGRH